MKHWYNNAVPGVRYRYRYVVIVPNKQTTIKFCLTLLFCYLGFYLILDRIRIWILDQQNVVSGSGTLVTCRCNGIQKYRCSSYYCMWCRGLGPGPAGEVYKSNSSLDLDHEIDILQVPYTQQQWIDMVLYQERF